MLPATTRKALTLAGIRDLLEAEVFWGETLDCVVERIGAADLMSDVLALSTPGMLLLTGLVSVQVIRTATVSDLCGVVFVRGRRPGREILELAREANIPVLGTRLTMYETAGRIYSALHYG